MRQPLKMTFRQLPPSREIESLAGKYAEKIDGVGAAITSCHVVVDLPHRNRRKGRRYRVRVVCSFPGRRVTASAEHTVLQVAVATAFRAVRHKVVTARRRRARRFPAPRRRARMVYTEG